MSENCYKDLIFSSAFYPEQIVMDAKGGEFMIQTATRAKKRYQLFYKTLQCLLLLSVCFFFLSRFSGYSVLVSYNSWFSALVVPLFANAPDRKYVFLICNGILAFLSKNLRCSSSCSIFDYSSGLMKSTEVGMKQISKLPEPKEVEVQESETRAKYVTLWNVAVEEGKQKTQQQQEQYCDQSFTEKGDEMNSEVLMLESKDAKDKDNEAEESQALEDEDEDEASVSTAELNKKFEEFIRKMKEEIRIEARRQLIAV